MYIYKMSIVDLYEHKHNQNNRDPISGGGLRGGQRGTNSLSVPEIRELHSSGYTEANLYRDLQTNTVPEKREKRTGIDDIIKAMGNHNDRFINRSLARHSGSDAPIHLNHINK